MIQLEWKEKDSDMYFDGYNLSDGTLRMIALTTLLMQPEPPQIIILDEPELGLHPMAINKLSGMIQSASVTSQIIISTQSVNLVNNFEPEHIIVVDRKEEQSIFNRLSKEQLSLWLDEYSIGEMWQKNLIGGQP
jgi:predicted ATPase